MILPFKSQYIRYWHQSFLDRKLQLPRGTKRRSLTAEFSQSVTREARVSNIAAIFLALFFRQFLVSFFFAIRPNFFHLTINIPCSCSDCRQLIAVNNKLHCFIGFFGVEMQIFFFDRSTVKRFDVCEERTCSWCYPGSARNSVYLSA